MDKKIILRIALPTPLRRLFDYMAPDNCIFKDLAPGVRIKVPFQSRTLIGILIEVAQKSSFPYEKLKSAIAILDQTPILPPDIQQLCLWAAEYYHSPIGEVFAASLPTLLRQGKNIAAGLAVETNAQPLINIDDPIPTLNDEQQQAIKKIDAAKNSFEVFLLDGVTGSGKTEIYLQSMNEILAAGKQVLVLVPEISLTPQTIARFRHRFHCSIAALHSNLSDKERLQAWLAAQTGNLKIVLGTRSALFTPFAHLGLIIVDEEHDVSFKQQDRFRYHGRDLAVMRAHINQIPIVLGSATPSLESLLNVKRQRYQHLLLSHRAGQAKLPLLQVINLHQSPAKDGLSLTLQKAIEEHLSKNNQVLLFLNRRGFAPVLYCTSCHHIIHCTRCSAKMIFHQTPQRLHCHHCDARQIVPLVCEQCKQSSLLALGVGTQKLEQKLQVLFPNTPVIRIDKDNTKRKGAMQNLLETIHAQPKAILLGTQMLAKGHHFPQVTLVGMIDADSGLLSADFRAAEQMGQLLVQVSGRAGRTTKSGTVMIQTYYPHHPLLQTLIQKNYAHFAQTLLNEREQAMLPPFSHFAVFRAEAVKETQVAQFLTEIKNLCPETSSINLFGPIDALLSKRKGLFRKHLLVKADKRHHLQRFLNHLILQIEQHYKNFPVKWTIDVDPVEVV